MLERFYYQEIKAGWPSSDYGVKLIVHSPGGNTAKWSDAIKLNLTYCVSKEFKSRYEEVVNKMALAAKEWQESAGVIFIHKPEHDLNCTASNKSVLFDVRPVDVNRQYLARAFFQIILENREIY
ncbi:hypothetical protein [Aliamphritea spongicola]|nr:hypothetical protein [Aliamphritea spongicola]